MKMKNLIIWSGILFLLLSFFQSFNLKKNDGQRYNYSEFINQVRIGNIKTAVFEDEKITGLKNDNTAYSVIRPNTPDQKLMDDLFNSNVAVIGTAPEQDSIIKQLIISTIPLLIFIGIFFWLMRSMQGGGGSGGGVGPMSFINNKAKKMNVEQVDTTFADVAGVDEAKEELEEVVEFLKSPKKFENLGGNIPRGVLMIGQPGTGKTLLAKAVAGEAKVPFFSISGSDFVEMFVGVGASRVRTMFAEAKKDAPCIIFIDEIDAVGRSRGGGWGSGNDEREQTLNQILVEMDGFEKNSGVIIIAATNRADVLDPALLRPGRFDRHVHINLPDIRGRKKILQVHTKKVPLSKKLDLSTVARGTPGFSGADLANLVNEAALIAARMNKKLVGSEQFEKARDKIMMGAERKSAVISEKDKITTAYHEAGHAIVGWLMPEHDPIHKVTIIPRGGALGVTQFLPETDKVSLSRRAILGQIATLFGGRIAEEIIGGSDAVTTGASNDIERATQLARNMVTKWGLSDKLGPRMYGQESNEYNAKDNYSGKTASDIDNEIKSVIDKCYKQATKILAANKDILDAMKDTLMEYETIDSTQVNNLMNRQPAGEPEDWKEEFSSAKQTKPSQTKPKQTKPRQTKPRQTKPRAKKPKVSSAKPDNTEPKKV